MSGLRAVLLDRNRDEHHRWGALATATPPRNLGTVSTTVAPAPAGTHRKGDLPLPVPDHTPQPAPGPGGLGTDGATPDGEHVVTADPTAGVQHRAHPARKWVKRTILLVIFLLVFINLVLPQLGGARKAAKLIDTVNPALLLLALALELTALVSYAKLAQAALPADPHIPIFTLFRVQLATKSVTNLVPAGSAAGGALGYRLLTEGGATSSGAGFAMATVAIGSAVVLNTMLWLALLISIPLNGFSASYGTAAIVGIVLIGLLAGLLVLLMKAQDRAERIVRSLVRHLPFVQEDAAGRLLRQIAGRLHELAGRPDVVRSGIIWAAANWLFDAASLWVFLLAFGATVNPVDLMVAFGLANVLAAIPITPGGLGVVEVVMTSTLVAFGIDRGTAGIGVVSYRLAAFWLPIPLGALAYMSLKFGPGSLRRTRRTGSLRALSREAIDLAATHVWDDSGIHPVVRDPHPEPSSAAATDDREATGR